LAAGLLLVGPPATATETAAPAADQASTYTSLSPVRVLDTRNGAGPVGAGGVITVDLAARIPATATAVVLNVTGVSPTAATFVSAFPAGGALPIASNLNLVPGDTRPNQVTVAVSADRRVSLYNNAGTTHLVVDLTGYYGTAAGAKFTALPANRILDTRWFGSPVGQGGTREVDLTGFVPASATSVTFNLTATNPTADTFVTAWPTGTPLPITSNVNTPAGDTRPNLVTVAVGANRKVSLFNNAGTVDLIVDLTGFYTADFGASFVPLAPTRLLDTRNGNGPVGPGASIPLDLADRLPLTSTGAMLNITGVDATAPTFVSVTTFHGIRTEGSTLNLAAGQTVPNAAAVAFDERRGLRLYNNNGAVHLIADLAGYFAVLDPPCTTDCAMAWGGNYYRQLGTAQATNESSVPTPVATLSGVRAVAGGNGGSGHGYALRTNGTVWAWGANTQGQLGNGWWSSPYGGGSAAPVPVVGLTGVTAIAAGSSSGYALRSDGTVRAWGSGGWGELGNGSFTGSSAPVQVTGLTNVVAIASGSSTGYALRADGTVWAWGHNGNGQLGDGSTVQYSTTPVQVSGLTGVTAIASGTDTGYALRTNGTVWSWGDNDRGQLGDGQPCDPDQTVPCRSRVPVQVSGLTGATAITGASENAYAIRTDGTVWAWGTSHGGFLGDGVDCMPTETTPCASRVPVRVSNLTDATQVASFATGGYALRANGTVMAWGENYFGTLGTDAVSSFSTVPVPVEGVTGATAIDSGWAAGYAIVPNP
jgi:alpha-tubulin suppressor-like RCC1 family protein